MAFVRKQQIQHVKGNNLTALIATATAQAAAPANQQLVPAELAINYNDYDPTIFVGTIVNDSVTGVAHPTLGSGMAAVAPAEFKSRRWIEKYVMGITTGFGSIATYSNTTNGFWTLKQISDTLGLLTSDDADSVVNKWGEIKTFLDTVSESTTLPGLLAAKATIHLKDEGGHNLYDGISIGVTSQGTYSQLKVLYTPLISANDGSAALTPGCYDINGTWTDGVVAQANASVSAGVLQGFYNKFNKMFTLVDGKIRANMDMYSIGLLSSYGIGVGMGGGGSDITVYDYDTGTTNVLNGVFASGDLTSIASVYAVRMISDRVGLLEAGSGLLTFTKNAVGFAIAGGVTSKALTLTGNLSNAANLNILGSASVNMTFTATTNITMPVSGTVLSTTSILDGGTF